MLNREFLERNTLVPAFMPVDGSSAAATGDRVSMKNYERCVFVFLASIGTAGDDPVISAQQHTAASGGTSANLNFTRIRHKVGGTAINAVGDFTLVEQAAAASYDSAAIDGAENEALIAVEVMAEDLTDGYEFVSFNMADVGTNAQLVAGLYILTDAGYVGETPPSAIA